MIRYGQVKDTPLGIVWIAKSERGIVAVEFQADEEEFVRSLASINPSAPVRSQDDVSEEAAALEKYFQQEELDLGAEIDWQIFGGFQREVLETVHKIPPGKTKTYGQIAEEIGRSSSSARAVGRANATNPIPIFIPCHRVIGVNGELTGYGGPGGIKTKAWLLSLEGCELGQQLTFPL